MIEASPQTPISYHNQSCIKIVVGESEVLPNYLSKNISDKI